VTCDVELLGLAVKVNSAKFAPAGTVTGAGAATRAGSELVNVTVSPVGPGGASRITRLPVVVVEIPEFIVEGSKTTVMAGAVGTFGSALVEMYAAMQVGVQASSSKFVGMDWAKITGLF
jgi:hypothetical protein